ncbi:hypothetical protein, partial [Klebsiella quasipneumoniae]|uniref:hypothetical protein n=1 Tax=Klebsiella quasipneumoniae TaxID=1463165 RepID=UPI001BA60BFF
QGQNQPRRDDFGLKIGKLSHRTSIKDGLGRHIGSCGPLNRNFLILFRSSASVVYRIFGQGALIFSFAIGEILSLSDESDCAEQKLFHDYK